MKELKRVIYAALYITSLVAAAMGSEPRAVYDNSIYKLQSGLPNRIQINTSQSFNDAKVLELADVAIAREGAGAVVFFDIERVPALEKRFGYRLSDQEIVAEASMRAEWLQVQRPSVKVGIWLEGNIVGAPYMDNLRGPLGVTRRARRGLSMSCDFIAVPLFYFGDRPIESLLLRRPTRIHDIRLHYRSHLSIHMNPHYRRGDRAGQLQSYEDLARLYASIEKDCDSICWGYSPSGVPFSQTAPWFRLSMQIMAGTFVAPEGE